MTRKINDKNGIFQTFYSIHIKRKAEDRNLWKLHRVQFFTAQTERKNQKQKNPRNKRKKKETAGILRRAKKTGHR
jgi:hypothetical protein